MARGIKRWSQATIEKLKKEGRGTGAGSTWIPWVQILDFYSEGRTDYGFSAKLGRAPHLLSDGEAMLFAILEQRDDVVDINEGWPFDVDDTQEVASLLKIRHQTYPGTHLPFIMTLDFMVTVMTFGERSLEAWAVKTAAELDKPGVVEALEIARYICRDMGIPFKLAISEGMPKQEAKNLNWFRKAMPHPKSSEPYPGYWEEHQQMMVADMRNRNFDGSLVDYCKSYEKTHSAERGVGMRVMRILLHKKVVTMDLKNPNPQLAHMDSFHLSALPGELRVVGGST